MNDVAERQGRAPSTSTASAPPSAPRWSSSTRAPARRPRAGRRRRPAPCGGPVPESLFDAGATPRIRWTASSRSADERFAWVADGHRGRDHAPGRCAAELGRPRRARVATSPVVGPLLFLAVMWAVFQLTTRGGGAAAERGSTRCSPVRCRRRPAGLLGAIGLGGTWVGGPRRRRAGGGRRDVLHLRTAHGDHVRAAGPARGLAATSRAPPSSPTGLMRMLGLPGRGAFLPLVVGFGCNVPAVSATRVLPHARQRRAHRAARARSPRAARGSRSTCSSPRRSSARMPATSSSPCTCCRSRSSWSAG